MTLPPPTGLPVLDFDGLRGRAKQDYIAAIQTALDRDYEPLERVFAKVLQRSRRMATFSGAAL